MNQPQFLLNTYKKIRSYINRFTPLKILIPILLISAISAVSFAASASISPTVAYQGVQGIQYNVAGGLSAANAGFVVTQSAATASPANAAWSTGGTLTTATVAGDWEYHLTVTTNTGCPASTVYTAIVQWNTGSGYSSMGSISFTTPATIVNGAQMTFVFNTGVNSFSAPVAITVTIG
jgi:hypothetical protein